MRRVRLGAAEARVCWGIGQVCCVVVAVNLSAHRVLGVVVETYEVLRQFALDAVVEGDDIVAQLAEEGEGAGQVGGGRDGPGHVKVVERVCGGRGASTGHVVGVVGGSLLGLHVWRTVVLVEV